MGLSKPVDVVQAFYGGYQEKHSELSLLPKILNDHCVRAGLQAAGILEPSTTTCSSPTGHEWVPWLLVNNGGSWVTFCIHCRSHEQYDL